jgi:Ni,Fe-hydrogenase III large subunit
MALRMREIDSAVSWLGDVLGDGMIDLQAHATPMHAALHADTLCVSLREGARGPVLHVVETNSQGAVRHYKVQDPSLPNWFGLALAVRDNGISDFPICNKSFDLSYCGNDL